MNMMSFILYMIKLPRHFPPISRPPPNLPSIWPWPYRELKGLPGPSDPTEVSSEPQQPEWKKNTSLVILEDYRFKLPQREVHRTVIPSTHDICTVVASLAFYFEQHPAGLVVQTSVARSVGQKFKTRVTVGWSSHVILVEDTRIIRNPALWSYMGYRYMPGSRKLHIHVGNCNLHWYGTESCLVFTATWKRKTKCSLP